MTGIFRIFPKKTENRKYRTRKVNRKNQENDTCYQKRQEIIDELRLIYMYKYINRI